ncbi:Uncharacterised protein [Mycobacteroides abscessus]|uniref:hypothetical protein n=1 Tax=Mycobacteroides abscessus TaxID=36809 RepID=UPI0005E28D59|nr:hypothetical protein [Mycobacteroides abscessus]CPS10887.1 Uncharacterised protein [Mycobacteroides abscessus]CPS50552.1 Uncharacterised protein [Mycobacteroides abscessus]CPS93659.1 Uncharacterised protein [Mycobacteroides abscessus]CPS94303.1 Uncharacterised protein [Mycobacteroides abscessus]CPT61695.1 Uncharacterised protein [Mycobacteroides abscessus]
MAHKQIPARRTSAPPISTAGISRAFVRMLEDAVRRGDHVEALKVVRGAETHFAFLAAEVGR